jgi:hypothetical protein
MEINDFEKVKGVIPTADTIEGRFVILDSHTFSNDFGSQTDLPGAHVPASTTEALKAKYIVTFAVTNEPSPYILPRPSMPFALRGGFDQAANVPYAATVYLTYPGNQEGLTIPSGTPALAYTDGIFTLPSGAYIYSADIIKPGAQIVIQDATTDSTAGEAGKPKYAASNAVGVIGETYGYDSSTGRLTIIVF